MFVAALKKISDIKVDKLVDSLTKLHQAFQEKYSKPIPVEKFIVSVDSKLPHSSYEIALKDKVLENINSFWKDFRAEHPLCTKARLAILEEIGPAPYFSWFRGSELVFNPSSTSSHDVPFISVIGGNLSEAFIGLKLDPPNCKLSLSNFVSTQIFKRFGYLFANYNLAFNKFFLLKLSKSPPAN